MIKILLCCGGGFSSSAIATRMQRELKASHLSQSYEIEFAPFTLAVSKKECFHLQDFDIIICCPHLRLSVKQLIQNDPTFNKPIYLLSPKIYGHMKLNEILLDVDDILKLYEQDQHNPVTFPGEENLLRITRGVAYRNAKNQN